MIIFNEGLPRSGKSHDAVKNYIIPMLKKGRKVFTNIDGVNHAQIAALVGITEDECRSLLIQLTSEQIPELHALVEKDSFFIFDEVQDFFPAQRQALKPEITKFVTQHGHEGIDMLLMGQNLNDCHAIWRNRVAQKNYFYKREAIGKPDEYMITVFKPVPKGKGVDFQEVNKQGPFKYDPEIFGCYKSHTDGTSNTETLMDARANIWNSAIVKKWLPMIGFMIVVAIVYLIYLFKGGGLESQLVKKPVAPKRQQVHSVQAVPVKTVATQTLPAPVASPAVAQVPKDMSSFLPDEPKDHIDKLCDEYRVRLAGTIYMRGKTKGIVEWRDESNRLHESLSFDDLAGLGWMVMVNQTGTLATLQRYTRRYIVTSWALPDPRGEVPQNDQRNIQNMPLAPMPNPASQSPA